jgi:hypothetical protein
VGVYKLLDILLPPGGESFGILRPDGSRRPAFDAYSTTVRHLGGFTFPVARQQTDDFYSFTFERPQGTTRVLWARGAADVTVRLPALADEALLVSATGEEETIEARNGFYRLRLGGARCTPACDIGGPPVFVVESGESPSALAVPTINPMAVVLATVTPTATPNITATTIALSATPTRTPAPSATPTATPTASLTPTATVTSSPSPSATPSPTAAPPTATATAQPTTAPAIADTGNDQPPAADADTQTTATPSTTPALGSWLFLGAGVLLAGLLGMIYVQRRKVG